MSKRLQRVVIILNPASGPDFPVLAHLNRALHKYNIEWEVLLTKHKHDAAKLAKYALTLNPDAIVVYGGDGTVAEVASVVYETSTPLLLLPGGTANILVKELGLPIDIPTAIDQLGKEFSFKEVDVAVVNDSFPLFLRLEIGIGAEIVKATKREQKDALGPLAYPLTALQKLGAVEPSEYSLVIDGVHRTSHGVGLMVCNIGNMGLAGVSLQPDISCADGLLDVFVIKSSDIGSIISISTSALIGTAKPATLEHWKAKQVKIKISPPQAIISDDHPMEMGEIEVKMAAVKLKVLV